MMIPVGASNPVGALQVMDWVYKPNIATMITEWVLYLSPAEGVQERILEDAKQAEEGGYKGYANKLYETAKSPFAFPDSSLLDNTKFGKSITNDDEASRSEEHTSELQSRQYLVCRLLLEKKKTPISLTPYS